MAPLPLGLHLGPLLLGTLATWQPCYLATLLLSNLANDDGTYRLADATFGLWLRWRSPGGTVVPTTVIGDEAEQEVARHLAGYGFELVYQARASRGAFDLLAIRGAWQLGIQVKRSSLPLRFDRIVWDRMEAEAIRLGWRWVVAAVPPEGRQAPVFLAPEGARRGREVRLPEGAVITNLLAWLEGAPLE